MDIAISGAIEFHILHTPSSCSCIQWLSCPVHIYTENAYISVRVVQSLGVSACSNIKIIWFVDCGTSGQLISPLDCQFSSVVLLSTSPK